MTGFYVLCVAEPGSERFAASAIVQVDSTPPVRQPELSVNDAGDTLFVEPIFSVPELSDFVIKFGSPPVTDCADEEGYSRFRRIPVQVAVSELPVTVCVIGSDEAGNEGQPYSELIEASDGDPPDTTDAVDGTALQDW